jgi:protocatechuate 3,4-dioxygenase alpha subunit
MTTTADEKNLASNDANEHLVPTPRTILGPYFTLGMGLRSAVEPGDDRTPFTVTGRVLNGLGQPAAMSMIETNQPEGWTRTFTGPDGAFEFTTVKPKALPGRAPHLALLVTVGSFMIRPAVTFLYFPDEANDTDELLAQLSPEQRATMLARATDGGYELDIHLAGESETTFLGWPGLLDDEE